MQIYPSCKAGYRLFHQGARALARVEAAGIRVDEVYLMKAIKHTEKKIKRAVVELHETDLMGEWRRIFGAGSNFRSRDQLGRVLVEVLGVDLEPTSTGRWKTDEKALSQIDHPFVRRYLRIAKLQKVVSTYLKGIQREVVDGFIHPVFNLHTVPTFRSSSDSPNFQNFPVSNRDPVIGSLVRKAFRPRKGRRLVDVDYKGIEVCVAACYHKDPNMLSYIRDPTKDMHRDMAAQCYCISAEEVTPRLRYFAKNLFVFPEFYGDWYLTCAMNLWKAIKGGEKSVSGIPVLKGLCEIGITRSGAFNPKQSPVKGTFEEHICGVEADFWKRRFQVYNRWKKDWYAEYQSRGWFELLTGFYCRGFMRKNEVINYPVQGAAFHCLLWSLVRLVLYELRKAKMNSLIVGQIHDNLVGDVPEEEIEDFRELTQTVMVDKLMKAWPWIITPLGVEFETYSHSWAEKDGE